MNRIQAFPFYLLLFLIFFSGPLSAQYVHQWQIGSEALGIHTLKYPTGLAVESDGSFYIADHHEIIKFDSNGGFLFSFGSYGSGNEEFKNPLAIALDKEKNLFVVDNDNYQIKKFDAYGKFILSFGSIGFENGQFYDPTKIAVDYKGNIYVIDHSIENGANPNHKIQKFNNEGKFIFKLDYIEEGEDSFIPIDIATDINGNFYVAGNYIQKFDSLGQLISEFHTNNVNLNGITLDSIGNIYISKYEYDHKTDSVDISDKYCIEKFDENGALLMKFGEIGIEFGELRAPAKINIDSAGNIYIADLGNHRIQKFDPNGTFIWQVGGASGIGQFYSPYGIITDNQGDIYVSDRNNHRIQKFDKNGNFLLKFGSFGSADGQFNQPSGIAIDKEGNLYVVDRKNYRVQIFNSEGNFLSKFGSFGSSDDQFSEWPTEIAFDSNGDIYVNEEYGGEVIKFDKKGDFISKFATVKTFELPMALDISIDSNDYIYIPDAYTNCIQKYDQNGVPVSKFGSEGLEDGQFKKPIFTTVDNFGNIYVLDFYNRIQKFDSNGNFLAKFETKGETANQFTIIRGITVDKTGNIFLVDTGNDRVQKFSPYSNLFLLYADSVSGYPEEEVLVDVRSNNFQEIISAQGTLEWDSQVAKFLAVNSSSLAQTQFNITQADKGKITFSWFDSSGSDGLTLPDSTSLFSMRFQLTGDYQAQTELSFTNSITPIEFVDHEQKIVNSYTESGHLNILPLQVLSGNITTEANQPVKNVKVTLSGFASDVDSTNADGTFQLSGIHPHKLYSITASKQFDNNYTNGLTSLDLAILQRHILGVETLPSPYRLIAADVNLSQSITTADIVDIQNVVLGNTEQLPQGKHWAFIPKSFAFEDPTNPYPFDSSLVYDSIYSLQDHDFIGIKLGDINDTWDASKGKLQQKNIQFYVEDYQIQGNQTIDIPIKVAEFQQVSSFQFTIEWDQQILAFDTVASNTLSNIAFGEKFTDEGKLTVLWYHPQGETSSLQNDQEVLTVTFKIIGKTGQNSLIALTSAPTPLLAYDAHNKTMTTEAEAGTVEVKEAEEVLGLPENSSRPSFKLYQNEPNPFTEEVNFKFSLPQKSKINFEVMNATGQVLFQIASTYHQGTHYISWNGKDSKGLDLSPGFYYARLKTGSFQQAIKILKK